VDEPGEDIRADDQDLYTYRDDVTRIASQLRQGGLTSLMMITQLGLGRGFSSGIDELVRLRTKHDEALIDAQTELNGGITGLSAIGQGAGIVGANYAATDTGASDRINGAMIDKLLTPPPPEQQNANAVTEIPLTDEERTQLQQINDTLTGQGGGTGRVMEPWTGAVTVTVPEVPALPTPPPMPGQQQAGPPAAPVPAPARTFTTARENELRPDVNHTLRNRSDNMDDYGEVYDENYRAQNPPDVPVLTPDETVVAPEPDYHSSPVESSPVV
jgi:hypothetical protein